MENFLTILKNTLFFNADIFKPVAPVSEIECVSEEHYISADSDPHFEITPLKNHSPAGRYIISYSGKSTAGFLCPQVFLDDGYGYRPALSFYLSPSNGEVVKTEISIPFPIKRIRIDPINKKDLFSFSNFTIKRIRFSFFIFFTWHKKIKKYFRHPILFIQKIYRFLQEKTTNTRKFNELFFQHFLHHLSTTGSDYTQWVMCFNTMTPSKSEHIKNCIKNFSYTPIISILMPVYNPSTTHLRQAIESVCSQIYPFWELCIADDASTNPKVKSLLKQYAASDPRIKVLYREKNGHISTASNTALSLAQGDYIALLDHDDCLSVDALFWVVEAINKNPNIQLIYSDEDKLNKDGERFDPYFKCDWNYDLFLSQNMINHLSVYKTTLIRKVEGFRLGFEGSQDYDLALRCLEHLSPHFHIHHIPRVLYHWRVVPGSTAQDADEKPYAEIAAQRAIQEHLERIGVLGFSSPSTLTKGMSRITYLLPEKKPSLTIIIPTRDQIKLLEICVKSILEKSTYTNFKICIVDNGSIQPKTLKFFKTLPKDKVSIIHDAGDFNFSRLNNDAVSQSNTDYVCLLNNDTEVITPNWIEEMLGHAIQPNVAAVGARLWYPDGKLQHGGVITGIGEVAGHAHLFLSKKEPGYFKRAVLQQSFSAVTGACIFIKRSIYQEAGGLDEQLAVAYNDIDFCLRLGQHGYRNVWTPYAELIHYESASRGYDTDPEKRERFLKERAFMHKRWGSMLENDPAYSPNLTLYHGGFSLAWPPRVSKY